MKSNVLDNVRKKFLVALNALGNYLSSISAPQSKRSGIPQAKFKEPKAARGKMKKAYSYKGSGHLGEGNINTDTSTFNKLRKEQHEGRPTQ